MEKPITFYTDLVRLHGWTVEPVNENSFKVFGSVSYMGLPLDEILTVSASGVVEVVTVYSGGSEPFQAHTSIFNNVNQYLGY